VSLALGHDALETELAGMAKHHLTVRYSRCSLRRRPGAARAKESINEGTRLPEQTSHLLRRFAFSSDGATALAMISPALREKSSGSMGATPNVSPRGEDWWAILLPSRFSGCGFFFMVAECGNWDTVPSQGRSRSSSSQCHQGISGENSIPEATRVIGHGGCGPAFAIAKRIIELALAGERDAEVLCDRTLLDLRAQEKAPDPKTEMQLGRPDLEPATGKREGAGAQGHPTGCATRWAPMGTWDPQPALMGLSAWGGSIFAVSATQAICEAEQRQPMVPRARQLFANAAIAASHVGSREQV
jgi:hypothetical protein